MTTAAGTIIIRERQMSADGAVSLGLPMVAMARVQVVLGSQIDCDECGVEDSPARRSTAARWPAARSST